MLATASAEVTRKPSKIWTQRPSRRSTDHTGTPPTLPSFSLLSSPILIIDCRECVLNPISRFCNYFGDINECIKKRQNKLTDYDGLRAKVKKLTEKPDKDPGKLPAAEREAEMAKTAYETLNEQLQTELPQLIDLRVPYLDPSFEALVKIQLRFCAEAYSRMAQVQQYLDADTREQYASGSLDQRVEEVLQEIRGLSIAGTV